MSCSSYQLLKLITILLKESEHLAFFLIDFHGIKNLRYSFVKAVFWVAPFFSVQRHRITRVYYVWHFLQHIRCMLWLNSDCCTAHGRTVECTLHHCTAVQFKLYSGYSLRRDDSKSQNNPARSTGLPSNCFQFPSHCAALHCTNNLWPLHSMYSIGIHSDGEVDS